MIQKINETFKEEIKEINKLRFVPPQIIDDNNLDGFVDVEDTKVLGYVLILRNIDFYEITDIAVVKDSCGVGKKLIDSVAVEAKNNGIKKVTLEVSDKNERAKKVYLKYGFNLERIRKNYYKDNSDALVLAYTIS